MGLCGFARTRRLRAQKIEEMETIKVENKLVLELDKLKSKLENKELRGMAIKKAKERVKVLEKELGGNNE